MATQTTGTGTLSAEIRQSYDKVMLHVAIPELFHTKYSKKNRIPKGEGVTLNWRRASLLPPATTPLTEGVTPAASAMTVANIQVTAQQYGNWVGFSDVVTVASIDPLLMENAKILGQNAGNTMDILARNAFLLGQNVQYANGRITRGTVATGDVITDLEIKKMVRYMKRNNAKPIPGVGGYVAIVSPETFMDLQNTDAFRLTGFYQDKNNIYEGRIISLYGVYFMETTNAGIAAGAGAGGINVHQTLVFGDQATATVDIEQLGLQTIYHPLGAAGASDPLNQLQTQGWKTTFAAAILNDAFMLRVEHAVTA